MTACDGPGVEPARPDDAGAVVRLRDDAARWLQARGIEQWAPGERDETFFRRAAAAGELFVVRDAGEPVAAVLCSLADEAIWPGGERDAVYVHGLVVRADRRGRGLGGELLRWAAERAAGLGRPFVRLDCLASNEGLRGYYRGQGFAEVGGHAFPPGSPWHDVTLFERRAG